MATIKQVADMARVSTATVSYVLNGTGTVTEPVRQRVLEAAAALDYQPSYAARSLRTHARTLGLVLPALPGYVADPLLAELLSGISEGAAARGYYVLLATARAEEPDAQLAARLVRSGRVDGVVLLDLLADDERAAALRAQNVPHVCAGQPAGAGTEASPFVAVDGRQGADDAPLAAHIHPALTTLRYDRQALGAQLAATLIAVAEHRDDEPRGTLLPMRLVIRKSTRNTRLP
jgi:DNA-binding LacI/PurR family transcriptional regulator